MRSSDVFINEINDIRRWLFTTIYAYNQTYEIISKKSGNLTDEELANAFNENGCKTASLARRLSNSNIKTCKELALIRSISALEIFVIDSIKEVFNSNKSPFLSEGIIEHQLSELLSCNDISELQNKYIEKTCRTLHSGGFEEVEKYYKKTFKIEFSKFNYKTEKNGYGITYLKQWHQKRHLIVHRLGQTDEQYRKKYNSDESYIILNEQELSDLFDVMKKFADYIEKKLSQYVLTHQADNVVEIIVEVIHETALQHLEPTFEIKVKKNNYIPLSVILKTKEVKHDGIYTITLSGIYAYIRKYYKILRKAESAGKLKIISMETISLAPTNRKIKPQPWDDVERVLKILPEKPWKKHIHKEIAKQLGWSNSKVHSIISYINNEKEISLSQIKKSITLNLGEEYTFLPTIKPAELIDNICFYSPDSSVIEVNNRTIVAIGEGEAIVSVMVTGTSYKEICHVTVVNGSVKI